MCRGSAANFHSDTITLEEHLGCATCEGRCPDLFYANRLIWQIWILVNTQWRVTFGSLTGLDYVALKVVTDALDIDLSPGILHSIKALEMWTLDYQSKEQKQKLDKANKTSKKTRRR